MKSYLGLVVLWIITAMSCNPKNSNSSFSSPSAKQKIECESATYDKLSGLSFVAPPQPFPENPMPAVKQINAQWIAAIPYGYTLMGNPKVHFNTDRQWWGERLEGITETVKLAKAAGIKVMLKPQVYVPRGWTGTLDFDTDEDWEKWEETYKSYILTMLNVAIEYEVELFCVGTEFEISAKERPQFWRGLIAEIRTKYDGKLTYAANWDGYQHVPFWDVLDYVGVDAYFPLTETKTPSVEELQKEWIPTLNSINNFYCETQKPILFTEYGYLTVDGCAGKTWELEGKVRQLNLNEQAQANAYEALFSTFWKEDWWAGGFLWKWFPNNQGHEGYYEKDYTPQDKAAEKCVKKWYGQTL